MDEDGFTCDKDMHVLQIKIHAYVKQYVIFKLNLKHVLDLDDQSNVSLKRIRQG